MSGNYDKRGNKKHAPPGLVTAPVAEFYGFSLPALPSEWESLVARLLRGLPGCRTLYMGRATFRRFCGCRDAMRKPWTIVTDTGVTQARAHRDCPEGYAWLATTEAP